MAPDKIPSLLWRSFLVAELGLGSKGPSETVILVQEMQHPRTGCRKCEGVCIPLNLPEASAPRDASVATTTTRPAWSPESRGGSWEEPCPYQDGGGHRTGGGVERCPTVQTFPLFPLIRANGELPSILVPLSASGSTGSQGGSVVCKNWGKHPGGGEGGTSTSHRK